MKYFFDTEFIEGFHKPLFGKRRHFIDLISIGIVAEDGREYHAISNEYKYNDADDWVKENVIIPLYTNTVHGDKRNWCSADNFQKAFGKSNKQIAQDIYNFVNPDLGFHVTGYNNSELKGNTPINNHFNLHNATTDGSYYYAQPEFYAYYADYDWVVFCSLFGRMIDLPKGFPMYCKDLKQYFDDVQYLEKYNLKEQPNYPKQGNEHNALDDARWNFKLFEFVKKCRM